MTDNAIDGSGSKPGFIGRIWQGFRRPSGRFALGTLVTVGFIFGVTLWGGFNWALELTNTEAFCISCHEMEENVYQEYRGNDPLYQPHRSSRHLSRLSCAKRVDPQGNPQGKGYKRALPQGARHN